MISCSLLLFYTEHHNMKYASQVIYFRVRNGNVFSYWIQAFRVLVYSNFFLVEFMFWKNVGGLNICHQFPPGVRGDLTQIRYPGF